MKKVIILETSAILGNCGGGSFKQANYYLKMLGRKGFNSEIFIGDSKESISKNGLKVLRKIKENDYVIGFGTPLLNCILQWFCFFLGKKGIFCIDTFAVPFSHIKDHIKKKVISMVLIFNNLKVYFCNLLLKFVPSPRSLVNVFSCKYIQGKISGYPLKTVQNQFVSPNVSLKKTKKNKSAQRIVLYYGYLFRGRGVVDLLEACRLLWQKGLNFKLQILGYPVDPLTLKTLREKIREEEKDKIEIKYKEENVESYLLKATLVVLPFRYPCSFQPPLTLLEPMGLGIPVITTDVGSHCEWVFNRETGLICLKENPKSIAKEIEYAFNNPKHLSIIAEKAQNLIETRNRQDDVIFHYLKELENAQ